MTEPNPMMDVFPYLNGANMTRALWVICELAVPEALNETPATAVELAGRVGADPRALLRTLRLLASWGFFREEPERGFTHTDQSRLLRSDHPQSMRPFVRMSSMTWKLLNSLPECLRTGKPAVTALAPEGLFDYLAHNPDEARIFNECMAAKARIDIDNLLRAYDFSVYPTIADIGGGLGHLIKAILRVTPGVNGVLFDLPHVIDKVAPAESGKLTLQAGNFFKDPLPQADAYALMNVIHDWQDPGAVQLLSAVRRAAPPHARILVIEGPLPETPQSGTKGPHPAVLMDFLMLLWTEGHERTLAEYRNLFHQAGIELARVVPTQSSLAILEGTPIPGEP